jgi:hypothetical protein
MIGLAGSSWLCDYQQWANYPSTLRIHSKKMALYPKELSAERQSRKSIIEYYYIVLRAGSL